MKQIIPGNLSGQLTAPPSKSMMQRAVAAAILAPGSTTLLHPSYSDDGLASLRIAKALGAKIEKQQKQIRITSGSTPTGDPLDCGESGLSIRLFSAIAALYSQELELTGQGGLLNRPMDMIESPLKTLGATITSDQGMPPLKISGPLRGGRVTVDGSTSSQFVSGLLMALPRCKQDSVVTVKNLKSKPYVSMTLELVRAFGIEIDAASDLSTFTIRGGQEYRPRTYRIEGDWSGASFLLVGGAIASRGNGKVRVAGLRADSLQADRAILDALKACGAGITSESEAIVAQSGKLVGFEFDATECPDLFPPLVSLASACCGVTKLKGATRLKHKESDRASALQIEFGKLGIPISVDGDLMSIEGGTVRGGVVSSHGDHRIAMATALAGLTASAPVTIENHECVAKSYPEFFEDIDSLRAH